MMHKVAIKREFEAGVILYFDPPKTGLNFAMQGLENFVCQPSSKWVPFSNYGRIR